MLTLFTRSATRVRIVTASHIVKISPQLLSFNTKVNYHEPGLFSVNNALDKIGAEDNEFSYATKHRSRMYKALSTFPNKMTDIIYRQIEPLSGIDQTLTIKEPTHAIVLYYKAASLADGHGHIPRHQDNGDNDGLDQYPIFSYSIGDACQFLVAKEKPKLGGKHNLDNPQNLAHDIRLNSGSLLVFGGPSRHIWHAIYKIHPNTAALSFPFAGGRLNITLHQHPSVIRQRSRI